MSQPPPPPQTVAAPVRSRPVLNFLRLRWQNWRARHQLPFNFVLHLIGIPLAVAGLAALFVPGVDWYWGAAGLVVGYLLQYVGHRTEGNDVGEWAAVKRLFGQPYVGISPHRQRRDM